jgi:hypothetical protein
MDTDTRNYTVDLEASQCQVSGSGVCIDHLGTLTLEYDRDSSFEHVKLVFASTDNSTLRRLLQASCTLVSTISANGPKVWAELKIPSAGGSCSFDWRLDNGTPPCTIKIVIKRKS